MSTADALKSALSILSDQIDAEVGTRAADASAAAAAGAANEQALTEALTMVQTLSAKLPMPPAVDAAALAPPTI
ncbi:hypothetical protein ONR75_15820 [Rhodopseudomonas sp. P2A-2r]|uniref:hypothetical protein n=1 Tax=Rhodopseudomonas sp. P2A-2r TaxID=2991972 RepID=UPI00223403A7|nr:hypothetical protein [Rhodopseudomonas sp. P2A-2r]UZE51898.1 hypothetical protein ONR75_15820 [Rhodopseudomonas sp. P2A-2r]